MLGVVDWSKCTYLVHVSAGEGARLVCEGLGGLIIRERGGVM